MRPLSFIDRKNSLTQYLFKNVEGLLCPYCDHYPFRKKYNLAVHMGFKHNDWDLMKEWCNDKGYIWRHQREYEKPVKVDPLANDLFLERKWKCAVCHQPKVYNITKKYEICKCLKNEGEIHKDILKMWYKPTTLRG